VNNFQFGNFAVNLVTAFFYVYILNMNNEQLNHSLNTVSECR